MTRPLLNLIEGSLYRSPLRLLEALQGERKRSWDLGYRHFKRYGPDGFDDSKAVDKAAYKVGFDGAREEASQGASQSGLREVSRASAVQTLKALPRGLLAGWFRNADRKYKAMLLNHIKKNPEVRNAGLNIMHQEYQSMTRSQVPFDEFMDTPIRMYRGGGSPADEAATSYSMDQKVADSFVDRKGAGLSVIEIKPRDTLGSYQTTAETEVLIPSWEGKDFMDGDPQFRGRSNYELQAAIGDTKAELRQDRSRLPELKARHGALHKELDARVASGHQSRNPYEVGQDDRRSRYRLTGSKKPSFYELQKDREHQVDLPGETDQFRDTDGSRMNKYAFGDRLGYSHVGGTREDHYFFHAWTRVNADANKLGFGALKRIGKGYSGATYKSTHPGHVVKFTSDPKEPRLVNFLHENPHLGAGTTMLPNYKSSHGMELTDARDKPISVMHRENIHSFVDPAHRDLWNQFGRQLDSGYTDAKSEGDRLQGGNSPEGQRRLHGRLARHLSDTIEAHRPQFHAAGYGRQFDKVAQDLGQFSSHGLHFRDLGGRNWGQRQSGEVVLRDPGEYLVTPPPEQTT